MSENYQRESTSFERNHFLHSQATKNIILVSALMSLVYFFAISFLFPVSNKYLFGILIATEAFHLWQAFGFWYTIWDTKRTLPSSTTFLPPVDVYITVCGEPVDVVEETARAAKAMDYPFFDVYLLNDGYVAKKDNWKDIEALAKRLKIGCITRKVPGGAKAGNINNAMRETSAPFVAVFDADHVPHADFLKKTVGYFYDPRMAFVQSPQFYKNSELNYVTGAAWEQQELFFGALCEGKNRMNAAFMCGTNMVIRRTAIDEAGGMCETNIAEDFLTSLFIHQNGWKSAYIPEVLAEGLAPEDFLSYYKQQFRWARGSLEVIFKFNPLTMKGLTWRQKFQYLQGASYYLSGLIVLINALFPLVYFYTGQTPFLVPTMVLASMFLPYIFLTMYTLSMSTNYSFTARAIAFSMGSFMLQIQAMFSVIFNVKQSFAVTSKKALKGNFLYLVIPHIIYLLLTALGIGFAIIREGVTASLISNFAWAMFYSIIFVMFIGAAAPTGPNNPEVVTIERSSQAIETVAVN